MKVYKVKSAMYLANNAYRRAAIMWSFIYSPIFVGYYPAGDDAENFVSAAEKRDYDTMNHIVDSFDGIIIDDVDLAIPPKKLVINPTAEMFCELIGFS